MDKNFALRNDVIYDNELVASVRKINFWFRLVAISWVFFYFSVVQFMANILPTFFGVEINSLLFWRTVLFLGNDYVELVFITLIIVYLLIFNRDVIYSAFFRFPILKDRIGRETAIFIIAVVVLVQLLVLFNQYESLPNLLFGLLPDNWVQDYLASVINISASHDLWVLAILTPFREEFIFRFVLFYFLLTLISRVVWRFSVFGMDFYISPAVCIAGLVNIAFFSGSHGYGVLYIIFMIPASYLLLIITRCFGSVTASMIYHSLDNIVAKIKFS